MICVIKNYKLRQKYKESLLISIKSTEVKCPPT